MKSVNIKLSTIKDAQSLVGVLAKYKVDLDLKSGRYTVDARSLIGIFAFDWSQPVELIIHSTDEAQVDAVLADVKDWIV